MKKLIFLTIFFIFFTITVLSVNAWWYWAHNVFYSSSTRIWDCWASYCETIPHITTCWVWDLINWDNRTAVWWTSPSPIFADNASDNDNHNWDFITGIPSSWNMTCYYWDDVKFDKSTYELYDHTFNDFAVADWADKSLDIYFQLKTLIDWVTTNIRLDNSTAWIDTIGNIINDLD